MIDTSEFEYSGSRLKDLYKYLKAEGYDVYFPEQHVGECLKPYLVIKYSGSVPIQGISTRADLYDIFIYVPRDKYSLLDEMVQSVVKVMAGLKPLFFKYNDQQTASVYDDDVKAHCVSIEYANYKKSY